MADIIYEKESYAIVGACFAVYNEFECQRIPAIAKPSLVLSYRGRVLLQTYQPDYVCLDKIILEIKAVSKLTDEHRAQLLNYLHAAGFELGLLVNFGHYPKLEYERIAKTQRIRTKNDLSDVSDPFASIGVIRGLI